MPHTKQPAASAPGPSASFDFDRVLHGNPHALQAAQVSATIAEAGELVRRVRVRKGLGQVTLAKKVNMTQPHISEIERGLGPNGPTVATLARILRELGDELLIQSKQEQAIKMAELIATAEDAIGEITENLATMNLTSLTAVMQALSEINKDAVGNPFKNAIINGLIMGIYMAIRTLPTSSIAAGDLEFARRTAQKQLTAGRRFSAILDRKARLEPAQE